MPDNSATVRALMDAIGRRDIDRLLELTDPEIKWVSFFAFAAGGEYHGHDALREYVRDISDAWDVIDPTIEDSLALGDLVIAVGHIHYRGRGSGVDSRWSAGWVFKFREGRVILFRAFSDPEQALEAVGA